MNDLRPGMRPRSTLGRRLDAAARHAFPASSTLLLMLIVQLPFGFAGQAAILPSVVLAAVWFWSLYRPGAMPSPVVFAIGLVLDLLAFQPLGVGVLTLLCVHGLAVTWRRRLAPRPFATVWLSFVPVAALASALTWLLTAALTVQLMPVGPALLQVMLGAALYPAIVGPLTLANRAAADPERA
jgi:rod shape-determining protein MreD